MKMKMKMQKFHKKLMLWWELNEKTERESAPGFLFLVAHLLGVGLVIFVFNRLITITLRDRDEETFNDL